MQIRLFKKARMNKVHSIRPRFLYVLVSVLTLALCITSFLAAWGATTWDDGLTPGPVRGTPFVDMSLRTPKPLPPTHDVPVPQSRSARVPRSSHVQQGQVYVFQLSTKYGVASCVDFDGSFWNAIDPGWTVTPGRDGLPLVGTMRLLTVDNARFEYEDGFIDFFRDYYNNAIRRCD